ncbi:MAG: hypothetical protein B7Z27_07800, partial [Sphingobacteriia bacterium 32-37-4]
KYSKSSNITVELTVIGKKLILSIKDNGLGFDTKTTDNGNGLGNMKKRSDALNGILIINSELNKGTNIQLQIPVQ